MQKGLRVSFDGRAGTVVGQMPHGMVDVRFDDAPERTERRHRDRLKALARTNGRPPRRARRARRNNEEDEEGTEQKAAARVPASEQEAVAARYRKSTIKQAQLSDVLMERRIAFSVQPDPPRMSKGPRGQRNYCGNPIDGAAYYAYVQTDKRAKETAVKWVEVPAIIDRYLKIARGVSARQELDRLKGLKDDDLTDIPIPEGFEYPADGRNVLTVKEARKWLAGKLAEEPGTRVSRSFINEYVSSTGDRDVAVDTPFLQLAFLTIVVAPSSRDSQDRTYAVRFGKPGGQLLRVKQKGKRSPAPRLPMGMLKEAAEARLQFAPKRVSRQETWLDWQDLIQEIDQYARAVNAGQVANAQRIAGRRSASPVSPRRARSTEYQTAGLSDKLASRGRKLPLVTKRLSGKTLAAFNKDIKSLKSWAESNGMRSAWAYEDDETYATVSVFSRSDAGARALREFNPYQRFEREINRSQVNDEVAENFGLDVATVVRAFNTSPVVAQALIESRGIRVRGIGSLSPGQDPFTEARDGSIRLRIDLKDKSLSPFFSWQRMKKPLEQVIAGDPARMIRGREFDYTLRRRAGSRLPYPPCLTPQDEAAIAQIKELENGLRAFTRSLGRIQGLYRRMAEGDRKITELDVVRATQSLGRALLGFYSAVFRFDRINEKEGTSPQVQAAARAVSSLVEDAAESLRLDLNVESVPVAVFERAEFTPEISRDQYGNATVRRVVADLRRKTSPRVEIRSWNSEAEELRRKGVLEKDITPEQKRTGYIEYRALPGGQKSNLETEREVRDFLNYFYTTRVEPVAKKKRKKGEPTLSDEIIGRETFKVPSFETKGQSDTLTIPIPRETGSSALLYFAGTPLQLLQAGQGVIRPTWTTKALNSPVGDVLGYLAPSLKRYPRVAGRLFEDMQFNAKPGGLVNIPDKAIWLRVLDLGQGFNSYSREAEDRLDRAEGFLKTAGEKFKKAEDAVIAFNVKYPKGVIDLGKVRDPQVRRQIALNRKTLERAAAQARRQQEAAQKRYDEALRDASQSERFDVKKPKGWSEEKHQEQMDKNWALAQVIEHIFDANDNASRKRAVQTFLLAELYYRYGGYSIRGPLAPDQETESRGEEVLDDLRTARIDIQGGQPPRSPQYSVFVTYNPVLYHLTQLHWRRGLKTREGSGWSILGDPAAVAALDAVGRFGYVAAETQKVAMESQTPEEAVAGLQRLVYPALATLAVAGLEPIERNQDINGNFNQTRVYAPFMCTWPIGASPQQAINNVADWTGLLLAQDGKRLDVVNTGQAVPIQYVVMLRKGAREGIDVGDVFGIGAGAEDQLLWLNARTRKLPSTYVGALVPGAKQYEETALSRIKKAEKLSEDQVGKKIDLINKTLRLLGEK